MSWPGACRASLPRQLAALFTDPLPDSHCVQFFGSGVVMTQRFVGFWHPFWFECKARVYGAVAGHCAGKQAQGDLLGSPKWSAHSLLTMKRPPR